ncbi:MAG TPA: hypothetical protein VKK79_09975 [Candidatus Lokiarchaeia archaeon]|nr:hypothetical protein [Candidatus Lokiarchaeia archaeon]
MPSSYVPEADELGNEETMVELSEISATFADHGHVTVDYDARGLWSFC